MANYNSGSIYNAFPKDGGAFYNGVHYDMFIRLRDVIESSDTLKVQLAKYILTDNFKAIYDSILQTALYEEADDFTTEDDSKLIILFKMAEEFGFDDELAELTVLAYLYDRADIIDEIKELSVILDNVGEEFNFYGPKTRDASNVGEKLDLFAQYVQQEGLEIDDLESFLHVLHSFRDRFNLSDKEPPMQLSETDWLIGLTGSLDPAFTYFLPFGLKVDFGKSDFQVLPESVLTTIQSPSVDGDYVSDVTYSSRLFNIVAYSQQGLDDFQKEELKTKIANLLASTKEQSKVLTINPRGIKFNVRYSSLAKITSGPSWIKLEAPLYADVYGRRMFAHSLVGSGLLTNNGSVSTGPNFIISGPCSSFSYTLDGETCRYSQSVPSGCKLHINNDMKSVWLEDQNGVKHNHLKYFSGKFIKIPAQDSIVLTVSDNVKNLFRSEYEDLVIW